MRVTVLALARFTLKGPYQAATVVGLLAVLAVFLPLLAPNTVFAALIASALMLLSSTLVGLIILTQGSVSGLKAIGVSVLGITLVAWVVINVPDLGLWTAAVQWLPIIVLAQTLRSSQSLALTVLAGVLIGGVAIAVQYLFLSDLEASWISLALQRMGQGASLQQDMVDRNIQLIRLFVLALVAMAYLVIMLIVLTARWLQARLAGSDQFAREFKALALGKVPALMALGLVVLAFLGQQAWMSSIAFLLIIAFMFQGVAVVHCWLALKKQARLLLGLYYTLLMIFPQVVALTSISGLVDNWMVFRKHLKTK